jgi:tetratricopeptide (TPR) repeat protein
MMRAAQLWRTPATLLAVLLAAFVATPLPAQQTDGADEIELLRRQVSQLSRERRFAEAMPISQRALMLAERQFGSADRRIAEPLGDLAYLHLALKQYADSETLYLRLLSIREQGSEDGELWIVLARLSQLYEAQGRRSDAAPYIARFQAIEQKVSVPFDVEIPPAEIITTDLKRMLLADCGKVSFKVDDVFTLLTTFDSVERARTRGRLNIASALRKVIGSMSSSDVRQPGEAITTALKRAIDEWVRYDGLSVREIAADFPACTTWK